MSVVDLGRFELEHGDRGQLAAACEVRPANYFQLGQSVRKWARRLSPRLEGLDNSIQQA